MSFVILTVMSKPASWQIGFAFLQLQLLFRNNSKLTTVMAPSRLLAEKSDSSSRYRWCCHIYLSLYLWIPCYSTVVFISSFFFLFGHLSKGRWIPAFHTTFSTTFPLCVFFYWSTKAAKEENLLVSLSQAPGKLLCAASLWGWCLSCQNTYARNICKPSWRSI